jgi:hypothetical protein
MFGSKSLDNFYLSAVAAKMIFSAKNIQPNFLLHYLKSHKISDL